MRTRVMAVAALLVTAASLAASCGGSSSSAPSSAATSATSASSASTASGVTSPPGTVSSVTTIPSVIEGSEVDRLPTAPGPSVTPTFPSTATAAGRQQFLTSSLNDMQRFWSGLFSQASVTYRPARLVLFNSVVNTACGQETVETGPFYCPADLGVYLDIRFFDVMQQRFGVGGSFAEAYVVAHEMGHHVQNMLGLTARVANAERINPAQTNGLSIAVELQADCYAGVWAHSTYQRQLLEPGELDQALNAAAVVGDDFQQKAATGQISPEQWTHGSSAQRQAWLTKGFDSGDPAACNTFAA